MSSPSAPTRVRWTPEARGAGVTLVWFVVAGVVAGVLWPLLWTAPTYTVRDGSPQLGELALDAQFGADAWYIALGLVGGLVVAGVRHWRSQQAGLLSTAVVLVGSLVAALVSWQLGMALGPDTTARSLRGLADGARAPVALQLGTAVSSGGVGAHLFVAWLAWPLAAMLGWSLELMWPSLEPADGRGAPGGVEGQGNPHDRPVDAPAMP